MLVQQRLPPRFKKKPASTACTQPLARGFVWHKKSLRTLQAWRDVCTFGRSVGGSIILSEPSSSRVSCCLDRPDRLCRVQRCRGISKRFNHNRWRIPGSTDGAGLDKVGGQVIFVGRLASGFRVVSGSQWLAGGDSELYALLSRLQIMLDKPLLYELIFCTESRNTMTPLRFLSFLTSTVLSAASVVEIHLARMEL